MFLNASDIEGLKGVKVYPKNIRNTCPLSQFKYIYRVTTHTLASLYKNALTLQIVRTIIGRKM